MAVNPEGRKILIVKLGAIGDCVMALYLVAAVRAKEPNAHITWVCGKTVAPVLRLVGGINRLIVLDDQKLLRGTMPEKADQMIQAWLHLAFSHYDLILTPYRDRRYTILTALTKCPDCRSFSGPGRAASFIPGRYHGDEYVRLYTGIDDNGLSRPELPGIDIPEDGFIEELTAESSADICVIMPGGASNVLRSDLLRRWPVERYSQLANELSASGYRVVLCGLESDRSLLTEFDLNNITDLLGKTSLPGLLALLKKAAILITHDTGTLHLAKLTRTRAIGLFGPVSPFERVGGGECVTHIWEGAGLACSPCYDGKGFAECGYNACMHSISVEQVLIKAREVLPAAPPYTPPKL